jgi:hypothetical protein
MTVVAYIFIDICNLQCRYLQIADIRSADICFIENHPAQFRALQAQLDQERQQNQIKLDQKFAEIKTAQEEQRRHAEEARLAKVASDEQAERLAGEYKQQLAEMEARMREENNEAIRQQME